MIGFIHLILIALVVSSPVWLDWRLILLGIIIYYIQIIVFGGCLLSQWQFKNKEERFWGYYIKKLGFTVDKKKLDIFLDYVLPGLILGIAIVVQVLL